MLGATNPFSLAGLALALLVAAAPAHPVPLDLTDGRLHRLARLIQRRRLRVSPLRPQDVVSVSQIVTSLCGSGNGRGRSSTASTILKTDVVAPMPNASVSTETSVKPGCRVR